MKGNIPRLNLSLMSVHWQWNDKMHAHMIWWIHVNLKTLKWNWFRFFVTSDIKGIQELQNSLLKSKQTLICERDIHLFQWGLGNHLNALWNKLWLLSSLREFNLELIDNKRACEIGFHGCVWRVLIPSSQ